MTTEVADTQVVETPSTDLTAPLDDSPLIAEDTQPEQPAVEPPSEPPASEPAPVVVAPTEPDLSATLAKAARINRGEDEILTAAEIRQLNRYSQSQRDQEVAWSQAEEQRKAQLTQLTTSHTNAKNQLKTTFTSLLTALTGQQVTLDDLTRRGLDASIDPLIDTLGSEAERIVIEPLMHYYRESIAATMANFGPVTVADRKRIASLDETGVLQEAFRLGTLKGAQSATVPQGKVLVDKAEYESLKTARANEDRAAGGERVPPRPTLANPIAGSGPVSQIKLAGAGLPYDAKALQAELDALSDKPLIPS